MKPRTGQSLPTMRGYARRCEDKSGYLTELGKLPSITTVIGETKSDKAKRALQAWLERPGAEQKSLAARTRGTYLHEQTENWILGKPTSHHLIFGGFWKCMERWLEANFHSALGVEFPVWHPAGFSGTADCLAWTYDDTSCALIDWKTSERYREESSEMVRDGYFVQLAAYRAGIRWTYGIEVDRALLVIARRFGTPDVYTMDSQLLDTCELEFFERLRRYQANHPRDKGQGHVLS
jgi:hypothetical protein